MTEKKQDTMPRLDKTAVSVGRLGEDSDERAYWHSKTPQERLEAMELMRQMCYGYDPTVDRIQRVIEVVEMNTPVSEDWNH